MARAKAKTGKAKGGKPRAKAKAAGKAAAAAAVAKVKASEVRVVISGAKLKGLMIELAELETRKDRSVGAIRGRIADAVKNDHLHKGVFAWIRKLDKMEPEELAVWLDTFEAYLDGSGVMERAESVPGLPIEEPVKPAKDRSGGRGPKAKAKDAAKVNGRAIAAADADKQAGEAVAAGGEPSGPEEGAKHPENVVTGKFSSGAPGGPVKMLN